MKRESLTQLFTAGVLASSTAFAGCASSDIDKLRSELADVRQLAEEAKATADQALQEAQAAGATANDAKAAADQAMATANDARAMSEATDDKLNQMFNKRMRK